MRSFLTMLGIVIGVAAVIILVGLINGQMSYMKESFASMGTNQIMVNLVNLSTRSVSDDEMYGFYEENREYFAQMSPTVSVNGTVKVGNESQTSTSITGVSEEYLDLKEQALDEGRFIQYSDIVSRQKVCVVGYYIAQELYGGASKAWAGPSRSTARPMRSWAAWSGRPARATTWRRAAVTISYTFPTPQP